MKLFDILKSIDFSDVVFFFWLLIDSEKEICQTKKVPAVIFLFKMVYNLLYFQATQWSHTALPLASVSLKFHRDDNLCSKFHQKTLNDGILEIN